MGCASNERLSDTEVHWRGENLVLAVVRQSVSMTKQSTSKCHDSGRRPAAGCLLVYAYCAAKRSGPTNAAMTSQDQAAASSSKAHDAGSPMDATPSAPQQAAPTTVIDEATKKDRALAEFMLMLDDYEPLVCIIHTTCHYHLVLR